MDPTLNSLAYKLLAEEQSESTQFREHRAIGGKRLLRWSGGLLITLGQRMQPIGLQTPLDFENSGAGKDVEMCM